MSRANKGDGIARGIFLHVANLSLKHMKERKTSRLFELGAIVSARQSIMSKKAIRSAESAE